MINWWRPGQRESAASSTHVFRAHSEVSTKRKCNHSHIKRRFIDALVYATSSLKIGRDIVCTCKVVPRDHASALDDMSNDFEIQCQGISNLVTSTTTIHEHQTD
jgi:hypothetical protein